MKKIIFVFVGAVFGHLLGWVLSIIWMACAGDLMMPANVYEARRGSIAFTMWSIIGLSTFLGGVAVASVLYREPESPK
jgi:hypothetical protein